MTNAHDTNYDYAMFLREGDGYRQFAITDEATARRMCLHGRPGDVRAKIMQTNEEAPFSAK